MKTQKDIEKQIEIFFNKRSNVSENIIQLAKDENYIELENLLQAEEVMMWREEEAKALLQQSKEFIEMIDNKIKELIKKIDVFEKVNITPERQLVHYSILRQKDILEELKSSIIGSEERN